MWQRIQTFYLFTVTVLAVMMIIFPVAGLQGNTDAGVYELGVKGLFLVTSEGSSFLSGAWVLSAITVLIPVLSALTIFLFKKRILQIRLIIITIVLLAGYYGLLFIYLWQFGKTLDAAMYVEVIASFPLISIILEILAMRAIGRDEALVKSLNRIR
jgi:hypothetical protein